MSIGSSSPRWQMTRLSPRSVPPGSAMTRYCPPPASSTTDRPLRRDLGNRGGEQGRLYLAVMKLHQASVKRRRRELSLHRERIVTQNNRAIDLVGHPLDEKRPFGAFGQ